MSKVTRSLVERSPDALRRRVDLRAVAAALGVVFEGDRARCPFPDHEDRNPSFQVWTGDDGVPRWKCWSRCGHGDVFDLVMRLRGIGFAEAVAYVREGDFPLVEEVPRRDRAKPVPVEDLPDECSIDVLRRFADALDWPVPAEFLRDLGWRTDGEHVIVPHYRRDGMVSALKRRAIGPGHKWIARKSGQLDALIGEDRDRGRRVVLVEGERDYASACWLLRDADVDVLALPAGAQRPTDALVESLGRSVNRAVAVGGVVVPDRNVTIMFDADEKGRSAARAWKERLGTRARVVDLPDGTDVSDRLASGVTPEEFVALVAPEEEVMVGRDRAAALAELDALEAEARAVREETNRLLRERGLEELPEPLPVRADTRLVWQTCPGCGGRASIEYDPEGEVVSALCHDGWGEGLLKVPCHVAMPPSESAQRLLCDFLSASQYLTRPGVEWIVDGVLPRGALAVLYGAPGSGKSFVALDLALCMATGRAWHGFGVERARVAYVFAEGSHGASERIRAWTTYHEVDPRSLGDFIALPYGVNLLDARASDALVEALTLFGPEVVVFDTFARSTPGSKENSPEDTGAVVGVADRITAACGASVVFVHHGTKADKEVIRGHGNLEAAARAAFYVEKKLDVVTVRCKKMNDGPDDVEINLSLSAVPETDSCVLVSLPSWATPLTDTEKKVLLALGGTSGETFTTFQRSSGVAKSSLARALKSLVRKGLIAQDGDLYRITTKGEVSRSHLVSSVQ